MIRVIHGEIWSKDFAQLDDLIRDFQSCVRFCYNRFHKEQLKFNVFLQELLVGSKSI